MFVASGFCVSIEVVEMYNLQDKYSDREIQFV